MSIRWSLQLMWIYSEDVFSIVLAAQFISIPSDFFNNCSFLRICLNAILFYFLFFWQTSCSIILKLNFTPILGTHAEWNQISGKHDTDISRDCSWESSCILMKYSELGFHCEYFCQYSFDLNFHYDYLLNSASSIQQIF